MPRRKKKSPFEENPYNFPYRIWRKNDIEEVLQILSLLPEITRLEEEGSKVIVVGGELYKEIPGHPKYWVSTEGNIIGPQGRIIAQNEHYCGYLKAHLRDTKVFVHRAVLMAFLPNENAEEMIVNHKDRNKKNNRLSNLEWISREHNSQHWVMDEEIKANPEYQKIESQILALPDGVDKEALLNSIRRNFNPY